MRRRWFDSTGTMLLLVAMLGLAASVMVARRGDQIPDWTKNPTRDFPLVGGDYYHQRYSALDQINTSNVKNLGGAWSMHLEEGGRGGPLEGTPIVIDGVMYVTTARSVLALDAKTGKIKWRYRPDPSAGSSKKGVVVAEGKVFFGLRHTAVALDQETGRLLWQTQVTTEKAAGISAPPLYYNGLVYLGTAGGDGGARGQMGAYDAKTGKEVWKFYTIPGPGDRFADTWDGESYRCGGGAIWTTPALDPDLGMIYVGTGNPGLSQYGGNPAYCDDATHGGNNLFTASIVALDLKTGAYKWHFQQIHHDIWHLDSGGSSVLADITYRGRPRKVLMNPGKTGFFYILDRTNGKPLIGIEEKPVPQEPRLKTARTQPHPIGDPYVPQCPEHLAGYERGCVFSAFWDKPTLIARNGNTWAPMTFSPKTGLAYLPANIWDFAYRIAVDDKAKRTWTTGNYPTGGQRSGMVTAMDPVTNKVVWQKKMKFPAGGGSGLLSTAGGLLFHGESDGNLVAFDISNGNELWKFQTGAGANAPVSTFEVGGEQYVAIMSGGNYVMLSQQSDLLWAFKLGGTVPEAPPPKEPPLVHPVGAQ